MEKKVIPASWLRPGDRIVCTDGRVLTTLCADLDRNYTGSLIPQVAVETLEGGWRVDANRPVTVVAAERCDDCSGTGNWHGAGAVINGRFVGSTGMCFRCGGTGEQTRSDLLRNFAYDRHAWS